MPCYNNNNSYSSSRTRSGGSPTSVLLVSLYLQEKRLSLVHIIRKYLCCCVVAQGNHTQHLHTTDEYHFLAPQLPPVTLSSQPCQVHVHLKCSLYFLLKNSIMISECNTTSTMKVQDTGILFFIEKSS